MAMIQDERLQMDGKVLGVDLGGTKLHMGVVDSSGQVLSSRREKVELSQGPEGLIRQIIRLAKELIQEQSGITAMGVASAGPLDPFAGLLLDPTNLHGQGETWGVVKLTEPLAEVLKIPVYLENDAAAAVLAEHWLGAVKDCDNMVAMTLGTGLGVGVLANGELLRSGRGLHPEVGHVFLQAGEKTAPCGCGNEGCAEAFLSGKNFARRCAQLWQEEHLSGEELVARARGGDPRAVEAFAQYAHHFALMVTTLVVLFSPQHILISGGFSEAHDLFLEQSKHQLKKLLARRRQGVDLFPEIGVSQLGKVAGLLGGAHVGFYPGSKRH